MEETINLPDTEHEAEQAAPERICNCRKTEPAETGVPTRAEVREMFREELSKLRIEEWWDSKRMQGAGKWAPRRDLRITTGGE